MSEPTDPTRPLPAQDGPPAAQQGPSAAQQGPPPKEPGLWRQATSTAGGTIAVIVAGLLTLLLVVGVLGVGAVAVVRTVAGHDDRGDRMEQVPVRRGGDLLPGNGKNSDKGGGKNSDKRNGNGGVNGNGPVNGRGGPAGRDPAALPGGVGVLGAVQHGEFTVQDLTGEAVVLTVQRGTVTAASATSVAVRSVDGFTATYAVDATTRTPADAVAKDDRVLVVAQKEGSKAVSIRVARSS